MAEGSSSGDVGSGNWWDSWYQAAKEKSTAAFELVKKDLSEFTCTVRTDTGNAVASTSDTIQENMKGERTAPAMTMVKSGISSILDGITRALTIPPDDGPVDEMVIQAGGEATYNRGQARLSAIQLDPGTYCSPPSGSPEQYEMWRENFDLEAKKGEISEMLVSRVEVRALYTKLVPSEVSHADFWARYFYKVHQLQLDEARKVALMRRAEATRDDSISWDDEEDSDGEAGNDFVTDLSPEKNFLSKDKLQETTKTSDQFQKYSDQPSSANIALSEPTLVVNTDPSESATNKLSTDLSLINKTDAPDMPQCSQSGSGLKGTDKDSLSSPLQNVKQATPVTDKKETDLATTVTDQKATDSAKSIADKKETESTPNRTSETSVDKYSPKTDQEKSFRPQLNIPEVISQPSDKKANPDISTPCVAAPVEQVREGSANPESKADDKVLQELKTREKGDMVVVGSGSSSPTSEASSNIKKEAGSAEATDEDWDEDFDIELTEEDIRLAEEAAKKYKSPETLEDLDMMEEDWNWD